MFPRHMAPGLFDETVAALGLRPDAGKHITRLLATDNAIAIRPPGLTITESSPGGPSPISR